MQKQAAPPSVNLGETKEENEAAGPKNAAEVSKMKVNELLRSKTNGTIQTECGWKTRK